MTPQPKEKRPTAVEMRARMRQLREQLQEVQGYQCAIPSCTEKWVHVAHIEGSGNGGRLSTYVIGNVCGLCRYHHDVFDGRQLQDRQKLLRELLAWVVLMQRQGREMLKLDT